MTEPPVTRSAADRNLLFGILALQLDFLDRDALIAGMNAWLLDKNKSLGHVLNERGALSADRRALLDSLVDEHVRQHGNDPRRSLEAVAAYSTVTDCFEGVADSEVHSTLTELCREPVAGTVRVLNDPAEIESATAGSGATHVAGLARSSSPKTRSCTAKLPSRRSNRARRRSQQPKPFPSGS